MDELDEGHLLIHDDNLPTFEAREDSVKYRNDIRDLLLKMECMETNLVAKLEIVDNWLQAVEDRFKHLETKFDAKLKATEDRLRGIDEKMNSFLNKVESVQHGQLVKVQQQPQNAILVAKINEQQELITKLQEQIVIDEETRKILHNTIMDLKGKIRVFCQVRPPMSSNPIERVFSFPSNQYINLTHNGETKTFDFDRVFSENASQEEVFTEISQFVQSSLDGFKVCIFVFGQTESGNIYTMGKREEPHHRSLIERSLEKVFVAMQEMQDRGWRYELLVSAVEVYNNNINDFLRKVGVGESSTMKHSVRRIDDGVGFKERVLNIKDALDLLNGLMQRRSVSKTQMNDASSQSHFVFTLHMEGSNMTQNFEMHYALWTLLAVRV